MDEIAVRRPVPRVAYPIALGLACVALFWGTATVYYHFSRLGTAVEDSALRHAIISLHDFLGVWGVLALTAFPFLWPVIFFFRERIGGLQLKTFGWLCAAGFASILAGLIGGPVSGGSFGAMVGGKLHAAMGQGLALVVCLVAMGMALFLATERFFSLPAKPTFDLTGDSTQRQGSADFGSSVLAANSETALSVEESKEIAEVQRFDLEKVLEIEKEIPAAAPTPAPAPVMPAPAPVESQAPVASPVSSESKEPEIPEPVVREEIPAREEVAVHEEDAVHGEIAVREEVPAPPVEEEMAPPPPPRVEEKAAELEEAVERATKDFILPPPPPSPVFSAKPEPVSSPETATEAGPAPAPAVLASEPSASPGMLDNAARLVIQEGRASVSLLQRRLSIPFSRASLLLDLLEREGVIGPYRGGPSRDILLSLADWEQKPKTSSPDPSALPQA